MFTSERWQLFSDSHFGLTFEYPETTPQGFAVKRTESQHEGVRRVHFASVGSAELYFEVTRYESLSPQDEYEHHTADLSARLIGFCITQLAEMEWSACPAFQYSFDWEQGKRAVILIEDQGGICRILYDPRSSLNIEILSTVRWGDRGEKKGQGTLLFMEAKASGEGRERDALTGRRGK